MQNLQASAVIKAITLFALSISLNLDCVVAPQTKLSSYNYKAASLCPTVIWKDGKKKVLLSREAGGHDEGTWEDFGGSRDKGEVHPIGTASREGYEESAETLASSALNLKDYIDPTQKHTEAIVVSDDINYVTYITEFTLNRMKSVIKKFYKKRKACRAAKKWVCTEKDQIALVDYDLLKEEIARVNLIKKMITTKKGTRVSVLDVPQKINIKAEIYHENGTYDEGMIQLRPVFVIKLQEYFRDSPYINGANPYVRYYNRQYTDSQKQPQLPPITEGTPLSKYKEYVGASILPITIFSNGNSYALLRHRTREKRNQNKWDDFGGQKMPNEHPIETASRTAWEKSEQSLMDSQSILRDHIDPKQANTKAVIVSIDKGAVTYIANFDEKSLTNFVKKFHSNPYNQQDSFAWVNYEELKSDIAKATIDSNGNLKVPVTIRAFVVDPTNPALLKMGTQFIELDPLFVIKLHEYAKNPQNFVEGSISGSSEGYKIKYFKRGYVAPIKPKTKPIQAKSPAEAVNCLQILSTILNRLAG